MLARMSPNLQGCLYMVLAMFGFTVNDLFVKYLGQSLPVFQIIALRAQSAYDFKTTRVSAPSLGHPLVKGINGSAGNDLFSAGIGAHEFR